MESHTSTPEWQIFEMRMRQRHVERCLLQAAAALDAGALNAAREALDEARSLSPEHPEIVVLAERLAALLDTSASGHNRLNPPAIVTVALLGIGLTGGAVWASTYDGGALLTGLADMAMTVAVQIVHIATITGIPQST
jgi:hypothetical protein